ncbi:MFS transporter [Shimia sagamensis]|uniref:Predicted arabinose efflux permease, MFS family n=1 Tax=Shimia sagamensis TaxID=1566352 RepID=A0ABY1NTM8_9RHOB|nr:MFS transporter [Shimia sagamensis]SMP17203.1 Predicted arabinose efflux permease, MFS family [Shimia sagamensis]
MIRILKHPAFAKLFAAQVVALAGTGLLTIALGLLAYDLAGPAAGAVLGTAYAIKMVAYVGLSPVLGALAARLPRRGVLIFADLVRFGVALFLPFVDSVAQIYVLIFLLQSASALFTPTFQAIIPDILTKEEDYTRALSLSRLAYDLENLLSPALAGMLLLVMSYHGLFVGTAAGFLISTLLILITTLPPRPKSKDRPFRERLTRGAWIYLSTPRLRGLLAFNMAAAASVSYVLVNTVVLVRNGYGMGEAGLAMAMGAFGAGSMAAALSLPRLLEQLPDRRVMGTSAVALAFATVGHGLWMQNVGILSWPAFLGLWAVIGALYSAILTPSGRLLRRSAHSEDRPAVFTAQFALSHVCWLVAYPLAGWSATQGSQALSLLVLGALGLASTVVGYWVWTPAPKEVMHEHPELPEDHPHLQAHGGRRHAHAYVIDDEHHVWPTHG